MISPESPQGGASPDATTVTISATAEMVRVSINDRERVLPAAAIQAYVAKHPGRVHLEIARFRRSFEVLECREVRGRSVQVRLGKSPWFRRGTWYDYEPEVTGDLVTAR